MGLLQPRRFRRPGLLPGDTDSEGARVFLAQQREVGTGSALPSPPSRDLPEVTGSGKAGIQTHGP